MRSKDQYKMLIYEIDKIVCKKKLGEYVMQRKTKELNKKRLVRYKEGAEMYSMGMNKFQTLAKDAGAVLKIDRMVLVDLETFDKYLETFRVKQKILGRFSVKLRKND